MLKTKRQASLVSESMKALVAEARLRPTSSLASYKALHSKGLGGKDSKEELKKVLFYTIHCNAYTRLYKAGIPKLFG